MIWQQSHRADPLALPLADRHYNRQKPGSPQFVPPGSCLVLATPNYDAIWVTSFPMAEYVKHAWAGAWMCSMFRNESQYKASDLIRSAVAATRWFYGEPPPQGMVTFIDPRHVKPTMVHGTPTYGWTWLRVGFRYVGKTQGGLLAFQLLPKDMPPAEPFNDAQLTLFAKEAA